MHLFSTAKNHLSHFECFDKDSSESCDYAHKVAENSIRTALIHDKVVFAHTRNLHNLLEMLPDTWAVKKLGREADILADLEHMPVEAANSLEPAKAGRVKRAARVIFDSVAKDLEKRGVVLEG